MMGYLAVGDGHSLFYQTFGNPQGSPILFLHGGPGGCCDAKHQDYFDLDQVYVVFFDQRGCGKSTPFGLLASNTTEHLIQDCERLRIYLHIERWALVGGSWGSTLALLYAIRYPMRVTQLFLRSLFLATSRELNGVYTRDQEASPALFRPEAHRRFIREVPAHYSILQWYTQQIHGCDSTAAWHAAREWVRYELSLLSMSYSPQLIDSILDQENPLPLACMETHYFSHQCFLDDGYILHHAPILSSIPITLVHGRHDMLCPPRAAYELWCVLPHTQLVWIDGAGHVSSEGGMAETMKELIDAKINT